MSRTKIAPQLIDQAADFEKDAHRLHELCELALKIALPTVREALFREAKETVADVWLEEARGALKGLWEIDEKELDAAETRAEESSLRRLQGPACPKRARDFSARS